MATKNLDDSLLPTGMLRPRPARDRFFARTAWVILAMVLTAFSFTYFVPLASSGRPFAPIVHIHGAAFFAWIGLYVWQTQLVASGRTARHRELGLAGVALSALLVPLGLIITIIAIRRRMALGDPDPFYNTLYNVVDIFSFTLLMIAGIAAVTRHVEWHRRFVFAAALCLVGAAISRWIAPLPPFPPVTDFAPNIVADLLLIPLVLHDRRLLGRTHPATLWIIACLIPVHLLTPFLADTGWWRSVAPVLLQLGE